MSRNANLAAKLGTSQTATAGAVRRHRGALLREVSAIEAVCGARQGTLYRQLGLLEDSAVEQPTVEQLIVELPGIVDRPPTCHRIDSGGAHQRGATGGTVMKRRSPTRPFGFVRHRPGKASPYIAAFNPPGGGREITKAFKTEDAADVWLAEQHVSVARFTFINPTGGDTLLRDWWMVWLAEKDLAQLAGRGPSPVGGCTSCPRSHRPISSTVARDPALVNRRRSCRPAPPSRC